MTKGPSENTADYRDRVGVATRYLDKPGKPFGERPTDEHPFVVEARSSGEGKYTRNGLSFETAEDGDAYGFDLSMRWLTLESYRVVDTRTGEVVKS